MTSSNQFLPPTFSFWETTLLTTLPLPRWIIKPFFSTCKISNSINVVFVFPFPLLFYWYRIIMLQCTKWLYSCMRVSYLYLYTKMCVCLPVRVFLGHFESDWDTLWHKVAFWHRKGSKTMKFQKKVIFRRVIALFLYFLKFYL